MELKNVATQNLDHLDLERNSKTTNKDLLFWFLLRCNYFALTFYYLPLVVILFVRFLFVKIVFKVFSETIKFIKYLFLLIHSEERLLCGTDAAIGVFIGYQFGHPIACGIVAAIAGIVNYELLSKRILKNALAQFH